MSELSDETSQTRFGPRPAPEGHRPTGPDLGVRRVLPHGDVSRDGLSRAPNPSLTAKVLTYGGAGILAAAATAGVILVGRKVMDALSPDDEPVRRRPPAHRPSGIAMPSDRDEVEASLRRAERARAAKMRSRPEPRRRDRQDDGPGLARTVITLLGALPAAIEGFRAVAGQADTIMREFSDTAGSVRSFMDRDGKRDSVQAKPAPEDDAPAPHPDPERIHRL